MFGSTEVKGMGGHFLDLIPTCGSLLKPKETVLLASKLLGGYELLNFENNVEQERLWANEGTTSSSSSTGLSSSRGGDVAYVVIWEGFL